MSNKKKKILTVILITIAIGCLAYLFWYYGSARNTEQSVEKVKEDIVVQPEVVEEEASEEPQEVENPIDFKKLRKTNKDVHGWITIDGTNIDYPIVQNEQDEYYLYRNWKGQWAPEGSIFTQKYNKKDFSDYLTVIYGHEMDGTAKTMFYQLDKYQKEDFMRKNQKLMIYTPERVLEYKIFSAVVYDDRHLLYAFDIDTEKGRKDFLDSFMNANDMRNVYLDDVEITIDSKIIVLSTCIPGESRNRLLIGAVLEHENDEH